MTKKVTIVSPSGAIDPSLIDGAAARLQAEGFDVHIAAHARTSFGRFAASADDRLNDLQEALNDPSNDFIVCGRGGYGLMQIVDRIQMPEHAPIVVGFSDITALHCLAGHHAQMSIHGVMCKHLSETPATESSEALVKVLQGAPLRYSIAAHPLNRSGEAKGILRGGNLSLLYGLQATPYDCPISEGDILFIEDVGEHPYAIDRMMQNLRLSGMLARLGGLVVGQFSDYDEDPRMPYTVYEGIRQMVEPYHYPVLFNFPAGHVPLNLPLILNAPCEITITADGATLLQDPIPARKARN